MLQNAHGIPVHGAAAGAATAWGVGDVFNAPNDDPEAIHKIQAAQEEFNKRKEDRLKRLEELDKSEGGRELLESRKERRLAFQPSVNAQLNVSELAKKQDEIYKRMQEARDIKNEQKKRKREAEGKQAKKKKKKEKEESSSSSESASSSSSSVSELKLSKEEQKRQEVENAKKKAEEAVQKQMSLEAKQKERELKRKAKEQALAWKAEQKRKEAELEAKKEFEAKQKVQELEAKKKADIKRKAEEEAKKKADEEEEAKKKKEDGAKKSLFAVEKKTSATMTGRVAVAGGFYKGQRVISAQNISVQGRLVVKQGTVGTIIGAADTDPANRISVKFLTREDAGIGKLNVIPREIKKG